jgi:hypothetical protein
VDGKKKAETRKDSRRGIRRVNDERITDFFFRNINARAPESHD